MLSVPEILASMMLSQAMAERRAERKRRKAIKKMAKSGKLTLSGTVSAADLEKLTEAVKHNSNITIEIVRK